MNSPKVSVIIPIYNAESSIARCLDSILAQTLKEMEIVCVDDGSTDGTPAILKSHAEKDPRIIIIRQENSGAMSARKKGLFSSRGEYIGFVDCDDWIEPEMFQKLTFAAMEANADLVTSAYISEGGYSAVQADSVKSGVYIGKEVRSLRESAILDVYREDLGVSGSLCTKLFRRELIMKAMEKMPSALVFSEDKMCVITCLLEANSAVVIKDAYYHYIMNPKSVTHQPDMNYLLHVNDVYKYLVSLYDHPNFTPAMRIQAELYVTQMLIKGINTRMGFSVRNLLWIDPYWIEKVPEGSYIALYGGGDLGRKYYDQLQATDRLHFAGCVDYGYERMRDDRFEIVSPATLSDMKYDCIIITIKNPEKAQEIRQQLTGDGVPEEKILWFEQKEIFWRFAEAEGLAGGPEK